MERIAIYVAQANPLGKKVCWCTGGAVTDHICCSTKNNGNEEVLKNDDRDIISSRLAFRNSKDYEPIGKPLLERHPQSKFMIANRDFPSHIGKYNENLNRKCLSGE